MSGPLKLTPWEVKKLGEWMAGVSELTRNTRVMAGAYGPVEVRVGDDAVLRLSWDEDAREYRVDDVNGY